MYFGSFGNNNLKLRGSNSGTLMPCDCQGFFNNAFVACFSWPYWNTTNINQGCSSWTAYLLPCVGNAIVNVGPAPASTLACSARVRNQDRPFGINLHGVANAEKVSFTNWHSVTTVGTLQGYQNVGLSNRSNYVGINVIMTYGYTFGGWRANTASGTLITTVQATNLFVTGVYGNTDFRDLNDVYSSVFSDRRLKENIRCIGKSKSGINIYTWNYKNPEKFGYGEYQGVMAQEVPHATVQHPNGYLMVDYSKTDVTFKKLYESNLGNRKRQEG